jgi:hypothetical protein
MKQQNEVLFEIYFFLICKAGDLPIELNFQSIFALVIFFLEMGSS